MYVLGAGYLGATFLVKPNSSNVKMGLFQLPTTATKVVHRQLAYIQEMGDLLVLLATQSGLFNII